MNIVSSLIEWTKTTFEPLGATGLFILAFMESSFFPIPPDLLLIVLCLAQPENALFFALICTIGSVTGGMLGYMIGYVGEKTVLERFISHRKIAKVHRLFEKYESWAIVIAGFTPIPYKVFTIGAGLFYLNFKKFVIASIIGRGMRFFILATMIMLYGESVVALIEEHFNIATIVIVMAAFMLFVIYRKYIQKKSKVFVFF
ncbi:MAG: DedA family protein [Nanoarchaeota archaeon]|nr:DedA family protein [Nanoarchaeota archaeon]MCG2718557.1 DedA family protein [Nanoarchaeota archaeon]